MATRHRPDGSDVTTYTDTTTAAQIEAAFACRPVIGDQLIRIESIVGEAAALARTVNAFCPPSREKATALRHLEAAVLWATAGISNNEVAEPPSK